MPILTKSSKKSAPNQDLTPDKIFELGFAFWGSKTLLSAIGMGLFTELGGKQLTLQELSNTLHLHPRSAHDFLDALVSFGMLDRKDDRYFNTPTTAKFL